MISVNKKKNPETLLGFGAGSVGTFFYDTRTIDILLTDFTSLSFN